MDTPNYVPADTPEGQMLADVEKRIAQYRRGIITPGTFRRLMTDLAIEHGFDTSTYSY